MRLSALTLPVFVVTVSALIIPRDPSHENAIAGSIVPLNVTQPLDAVHSVLDIEYEKLEELKYKLYELHHEVLKKEHDIFVLINEDFRSCLGVKCYLQTALKKAPDFLQLVKTHFRHHPKNATAGSWDCPWTTKEAAKNLPHEPSTDDGAADHPSPPPCHKDGPFDLDCTPVERPAHLDVNDSGAPEPPKLAPPKHDEPIDFGDLGEDVPPPPPHHPEYDQFKPNPHSPAAHPYDHKPGHTPFHMPHPAPPQRHFKLILAVAGLVISTFILAILIKAARIYFSNPRVRADRAAHIEECRTRREYRRAACQHRIRQCLGRFRRRSSSTDDYEEKRAMLQQCRNGDSDISSHIVGADIDSLRRTHAIVGQLMRAEEGRMHDPEGRPHRVGPAELPSSSRSVRSMQTLSTLPLYAPPLPRYSQELSRDTEVVDGFRYTPSQSEATEVASSASSFILNDDDLCTESSVMDCRSRMSLETDSVVLSQNGAGNRKSLELAGDRFRGRFD